MLTSFVIFALLCFALLCFALLCFASLARLFAGDGLPFFWKTQLIFSICLRVRSELEIFERQW